MTTDQAADNLRVKHNLPAGEPPVAVYARGIINKRNEVILEADNTDPSDPASAGDDPSTQENVPIQKFFYGAVTITGRLSVPGQAVFAAWPL